MTATRRRFLRQLSVIAAAGGATVLAVGCKPDTSADDQAILDRLAPLRAQGVSGAEIAEQLPNLSARYVV